MLTRVLTTSASSLSSLASTHYHHHRHYHHYYRLHTPHHNTSRTLLRYFTGSWTHSASLVSTGSGHKDFAANGVAVYANTIAVGSDDTDDVRIYTDTGTYVAAVSVPQVLDVAMYGDVIVSYSPTTLYVFELITGSWTETATLSYANCLSLAIYGGAIVASKAGTVLSFDSRMSCLYCLHHVLILSRLTIHAR